MMSPANRLARLIFGIGFTALMVTEHPVHWLSLIGLYLLATSVFHTTPFTIGRKLVK